MNFTDIFIKRPVFATVLSLIILLVGIRSYFSLSVRLFPKVNASAVTITTIYAGADSELMEGFVTTPIENALGGVDGIDYIRSVSAAGVSQITVAFQLGVDINAAVTDISSKVSSVRYALPKDINDPVVAKYDPNSNPSIYVNFSSDSITPEQVTDYVLRVIQPQIQTLPGVGSTKIWGSDYGMRIWLDPTQMASHRVTASDVVAALNTESLQAPAGQLKSAWQVFNVKTLAEANNAQQFNEIVLNNLGGNLVKIKDIGKAELGAASTDKTAFIDGKHSVVAAIIPAPNANPLDVTTEFNKLFPKILANLPSGIRGSIFWDSSKFIEESIKEVKKTIIEACLCVIFVVLLFLGSWRSLLVPVVTIPLSLIGVCGIMFAMSYSLNTITFLALVLAIGMVVDDAIVVLENIYRHLREGKTPVEAAIIGAKEIQFAIIAMTFTLAAVYAPIGFLTGLVGSLFKEFAFTLASAVVISGFIALTLSPMMCSKLLNIKVLETGLAIKVDRLAEKLMSKYREILEKLLQKRKVVFMIIPAVLLLSAIIAIFIKSELVPQEDGGYILVVGMGPTSANIDYTTNATKKFDAIYKTVPEIVSNLAVNGDPSPNSAFSVAILKPWSQRHRTANDLIAYLQPKLWAIPEIMAFPINPPNVPGANGSPIMMVLESIGDYNRLSNIANKIVALAHNNPRLINVDIDPKFDQPQVNIDINRDKAGSLGVPISAISSTINLGLGQPTVSHFSIMGRSYDVIPQLYPEFSNKPDTLNNLYLHTSSNQMVPLSNLVTLKQSIQPQSIKHFQQLRSITISASMMPGYTLGQALDYLQTIAKQVVPKDIQIDFSGISRQFFQTSGQMTYTFLFAIIFIFLVLAAQFESFRDPFIVLFCIPLSIFGALLAMLLTGSTLNIYSQIGLLTLVGLITKHGILLVEFANQLQETGKNIHEAIVAAAAIRLRPILMTTAAMVLGAIPLALASGAGAVSRQQMGWVIIGGMLVGTSFTLFVVPLVYTYLASKKHPNI